MSKKKEDHAKSLEQHLKVQKLNREMSMIDTYDGHIDRLQVQHLPRPNTFTEFEHLAAITQESFDAFKSNLKSKLSERKENIQAELKEYGKQETKQAAEADSK